MKPRYRSVAMALVVSVALVPTACGGDDDSATDASPGSESQSGSDPSTASTDEGGESQSGSTDTTTFEVSDDLSFSVPSDWQSLGAGMVGSEEFIAPQANISVRGPEARRETYGESVAEGDDFAAVAAAEAQTLAGDSVEPEIDGTIATVEMEVAGAEAMVVVVDLGNGEYASVFVSAAGENPIPDATRAAVRKVASSMTPG